MKRAIVTGPTGAIGAALVGKLLQEGIEVEAIVNPQSGRLSNLPQDDRRHIVQCSLANLASLDRQQLGSCDAFFHLAWMGTTGAGRDDMYLQNENIKYALDSVKLAKRCGCIVYLGVGSQAEYGRAEGKLTASTSEKPEMGYGIAKLCAGQMTRILCQQLDLRHIWARVLSVYGPCDGEHSMIMSGIRTMLRGECPPFSQGEQLWDYLYSEDAANALYLLALSGKSNAIYPVGSGTVRPLREYIQEMCHVVSLQTGKKTMAGIGALPYREGQVMYLCADISDLTRDTGFVPRITFNEGISKTVEWCKTHSYPHDR